jgi:hypothetical protein
MELFICVHDTLYAIYSESLSGSTHYFIENVSLMEYSVTFANPHKVLKKLKAQSIRNEAAVAEIFKMKKFN